MASDAGQEAVGMTARPSADDRPDGIRALLFDLHRHHAAVANHQAFEGAEVQVSTALESYDRQLHPWLHGRRPADIAAKAREVLGL